MARLSIEGLHWVVENVWWETGDRTLRFVARVDSELWRVLSPLDEGATTLEWGGYKWYLHAPVMELRGDILHVEAKKLTREEYEALYGPVEMEA